MSQRVFTNLYEQRKEELNKDIKHISYFLITLFIIQTIIYSSNASIIHLLLSTLIFVSIGGEALIQLEKKMKKIELLTAPRNPRS